MNNNIEYSDEGKVGNERYHCYGRTMIGGRKENQDSFSIYLTTDARLIVTVCDGMGGAAGGATASRLAVKAIVESLMKTYPFESGEERTRIAVRTANENIYKEAIDKPSLRGMGSTATVVLFDNTAAYIAHIGDSRIYQIRHGKKYFRTNDHSKVFEMVKAGILTEEQARTHPQSNLIMRALGVRPEVEVDTRKLAYKRGDRFVLCCDGIWNSMPETELIKIFCMDDTAENVGKILTERIDALGREAGGNYDNLTAIIVDMKEDSKYQPSIFCRIKSIFSKK